MTPARRVMMEGGEYVRPPFTESERKESQRNVTAPTYGLSDYEAARRAGRIIEGDESPDATNKTRANALIAASRRLDRDAREWAAADISERGYATVWSDRTHKVHMVSNIAEWDVVTGGAVAPSTRVNALKVDA